MSIPQNRSTHQGPEAFRETIRRITEEIQNNHRPGYGVQIPQSLLETDLPSMAIAIRNVGRFAVVLDPATAASGDGPSHQTPEIIPLSPKLRRLWRQSAQPSSTSQSSITVRGVTQR